MAQNAAMGKRRVRYAYAGQLRRGNENGYAAILAHVLEFIKLYAQAAVNYCCLNNLVNILLGKYLYAVTIGLGIIDIRLYGGIHQGEPSEWVAFSYCRAYATYFIYESGGQGYYKNDGDRHCVPVLWCVYLLLCK
jgi:hypothetical protein